jgi:hypothetical protein
MRMKLRLRNPAIPHLVEDANGEDVLCRAVSDDRLLELVDGSDDVLLVAPGESLPRLAHRIGELLAAARAGMLPGEGDEVYCSGLQLLAGAHLSLRDHARRHALAGLVAKSGADGAETIAVVAIVPTSIAAAQIRVDLDGGAA